MDKQDIMKDTKMMKSYLSLVVFISMVRWKSTSLKFEKKISIMFNE